MDTDRKRFIKYLKITDNGCWEWQAAIDKDGYGLFTLGKLMSAHRAAYLLFKGEIKEGLQIDHLCRNHPCVNPDHLEAVTPKVNTLRSPIAPAAINSRKTHCYKGHEFTGDNLYIVGTTGERRCRTCTNALKALRRAKARQARIDAGEVITKGPKRSSHCLHGHPKTETASGRWHCRECSRIKTARSRQKLKNITA